MSSDTYHITNFLTTTQQRTLSTVNNNELKQLILSHLHLKQSEKLIQVARATLDVINKINASDHRDKFFIHLIKEMDGSVSVPLQKISLILREGFFEEFLQHVNTPKKEYHSQRDLVFLIDKFCNVTLPRLLGVNATPIAASSNDTISLHETAYSDLMQCSSHHKFVGQINHYVDLRSGLKDHFTKIVNCILDKLDGNLKSPFTNYEKTSLAKVALRTIAPEITTIDSCHAQNLILNMISIADQIKRQVGDEVLANLYKSFLRKNDLDLEDFIDGMNLLLNTSKNKKCFYQSVASWKATSFAWDQLTTFFKVKQIVNPTENTPEDDIETRLQRFKNDPTVQRPLSDTHIQLIKEQYYLVEGFCKEYRTLGFPELIRNAHTIRNRAKSDTLESADRFRLIALGRLVIQSHFGIYPYNTQILALLGILVENKSWQAQVKTGEGKSTIIALWAFVMAMECQSADIITSARPLAIRDQIKFAQFFKNCDIITNHICHDKQKPEHFEAQVLYGPVFDFEFAWMKDILNNTNLFAARLKNPYVKRNFDCVCVDESDNLLVDGAQNAARMSSPAEISYDWIYVSILKYVRQHFAQNPGRMVTPNDINLIRQILVTVGGEKQAVPIPENKIKDWIKSACNALFILKQDIDYVVLTTSDHNGNRKREMKIVDIQTGRISENSRWGNGLHEFVEIKHDIVVMTETLTPISISHAVYYSYYRTVTALTGTAEFYQTKRIYGIESFDVPPHRPFKRIDHPAIIVNSVKNHYMAMLHYITQTRAQNRPVLVLCETIQDSKNVSEQLRFANIPHKVINEIQEEAEEVIISVAGLPGNVTVATNTAARGTDIILSEESLKNGGLQVYPVFFPDSSREYYQAVGRAGRQGQPGSSQMILCRKKEVTKWGLGLEALLPNDLFIQALEIRRSAHEESTAQSHVYIAKLARHLAVKAELFFTTFRQWADIVECEQFYERYSQALSTIKLAPNKVLDFTLLSELDLKLAENGKDLLLARESQPLQWKIYIKALVHRLQSKVIADWTLNFYQPISDDISSRIQNVDLKKTEIDAAFELRQTILNVYLAPDGTGILTYLKEIIGIDFLTILRRLNRL